MSQKSLFLLIAFILLLGAPTITYCAPVLQSAQIKEAKQLGNAFSQVAKKALPAVVFVNVEKDVMSYRRQMDLFDFFGPDLFERFFRHRSRPNNRKQRRKRPRKFKRKKRIVGQGTGFIISSNGYVLTNSHVVEKADSIRIKLHDGREKKAKVIGVDSKTDVGLLKIEGKDFPFLELGTTRNLEVGHWVIAVGNPFGMQCTVTAGIVSAKGRSRVGILDYEDFIQTDAAINPGNSGGPLLDLNGCVVGMNTAILSRSGGNMGIGLAIPVEMLRHVQLQLRTKGKMTRGFLGVVIQELTPELAKSLNEDVDDGLLVSQVEKGSPAHNAGIKQGDLIVALDGEKVDNLGRFRNKISLFSPGTIVELTIRRNKSEKMAKVKLAEQKEKMASKSPVKTSQDELLDKYGFNIQDLNEGLRRRFDIESDVSGVIVAKVYPYSSAAASGIKVGTIIREVNREPISSVAEFIDKINQEHKDGVLLLVEDDGIARYIVLD